MAAKEALKSLGRVGTVGGRAVSYAVRGRGPHAVLCLPGALGSWRTDFPAQLLPDPDPAKDGAFDEERFKVVAWDPLGYGESRPPERDWSPGYFERDALAAKELMEGLGLGHSFSVLGWSDGGITALYLAHLLRDSPSRLRKVVVWGANAFVDEQDIAIYNGIRDIDQWSERMRAPFVAMYGEAVFRENWAKWCDAFGAFHENPKGSVCLHCLPSLTQKKAEGLKDTLVIHGAKDPVVPQHHAEFLARELPKARLLLHPDGKHNLHLRYPQWFRHTVQDFLDDHTSKL